MANSRAMREVERWVRDEWLPLKYEAAKFAETAVQLDAGGIFKFDAVSSDGSILACVCTSSGVTAGGKKGNAHLHKIHSDILFLNMAAGVASRLLILTDRRMYEICEEERKKGRMPANIEFVLAEPPPNLQSRLDEARRVAAQEVTPQSDDPGGTD